LIVHLSLCKQRDRFALSFHVEEMKKKRLDQNFCHEKIKDFRARKFFCAVIFETENKRKSNADVSIPSLIFRHRKSQQFALLLKKMSDENHSQEVGLCIAKSTVLKH